MKLYPMRLTPVPKEILWGGTRLKEKYNKSAPFERIAESWELTVRKDGMNGVANGPYAGMTLGEFLAQAGPGVVSGSFDGERFPLLIKFIDACDRLSIQVHPDNDYALAREGELGKTEMWYIVEADPGAQLVYGLRPGISVEDFAALIREKRTEDGLRFVNVRPGECYFIPAGQVHAIGSGILIAEIQQSSNVTYRVYDYERRQKDGSLRALHVEKALDVIRVRSGEEIRALRFAGATDGACGGPGELLADCEYFRVRKLTAKALPTAIRPDESFTSLLCLAGDGAITCEGERYPVRKGDSYFLPRGCADCCLTAGSEDFAVLLSETKE